MLNGIGNVELVGSIKIGSTEYTVDQLNSQLNKNTTPIGTIFYHISSVPPEGAFLLNGQVIYNCSTLYPEFYQYVTSNNGIRKITSSVYESELSSIGICGGFVVDSENGSIRLPNISNGFIEGSNGSNIGNTLDAGLPNIEGWVHDWLNNFINPNVHPNESSGAFYTTAPDQNERSGSEVEDPTQDTTGFLYFDASRSSPIYGNSNTVQPKSVCYSVCIQVFNTTTSLSNQESTQLASEMQGKAGINLENITANGKALIQLYANELDYVNTVEDQTSVNVLYTTTTGGIVVAYGVNIGQDLGAFSLQTSPNIITDYDGIQTGGNLISGQASSLYIIVPKGWRYVIGTIGNISVYKTRFIPFKNS